MPELSDFVVGQLYDHKNNGPCRVLINHRDHSVVSYRGYLLVQYENPSLGWFARIDHPLIPHNCHHLHGLSVLQWVPVHHIDLENTDGYEVDCD